MRPQTTSSIRIRLLGPVELVPATGDLGGPKRRLLLAALALRPRSVVTTDVLVDALWAGRHPDDPRRALQVHMSKLRSALEASGLEGPIDFRGGGYALQVDPHLVDVTCFEALVREGVAARNPEQARGTLRRALALWRGTPLEGLAGSSVLSSDVTRLEGVHVEALRARIAADLDLGHHADVVPELRQLTVRHPLQEPLWELLLLALYRAGRQGEALAEYERARHALAAQLGADPSRDLQTLHGRILHQDPALDVAPGPTLGRRPRSDEADRDDRSVAVLPFEVIGGSPDADILASGLHTDLLTELSNIPGLTVISRSSVRGYRDTDKPVPLIARELDVGTVVTGTVQSVGTRFRVTVQLVDGSRGVPRWTESYDDELTTDNLFSVQAELARDVAASLAVELPVATTRDLPRARRRARDLRAYRLVARGHRELDVRTADGLARAIALYQEAALIDPDDTAAWIGLCDALVLSAVYGHGDRHELLPRAERAVHHALALSPGSAEARTSLGVLATGHQDGPQALTELERGRRLRPSYSEAHSWHSWVSMLTGDARSGLASARRAVRLDPRSPETHAHVGLGLAATGDAEAGLHAARTAGRLSSYSTGDLYQALCLFELGRFHEARSVLRPLARGVDDPPVPWTEGGPDALLVLTLRNLGDDAGARQIAAAVDPVVYPFAAGMIRLAFGETEEAERAFDAVERMSAWPCLIVHHFHRQLWESPGAPTLHRRLVGTAMRSWGMGLGGIPRRGEPAESRW